MLEEIKDIFSSSILVTGLVVVMMMLIECFNVLSKGRFTESIRKSGPLQVVIAALLGAVPGCMGGFAVVSLYTHRLISFGALIAMMIASSGDEAFVMLAMMPDKAWIIILALTVLSIVVGIVIDLIHKPVTAAKCPEDSFAIHSSEDFSGKRHFGWKRISILCGVCLFLAALVFGFFDEGHDHGTQTAEFCVGGINLLSEDWMNVLFAVLGVLVLLISFKASDHFVDEHLFHHIICRHLPKIFLWTAGTLTFIAVLMHFVDVSSWISENVLLMILIAAAVGIIPESGPHLVFVTLFASGIVPVPVLVASCISQDGHAALPLLAEDKKTFLRAKAINFIVALASGLVLYML